MKNILRTIYLVALFALILNAGCATSYRDRLDALSVNDDLEEPVDDGGGIELEQISRDEIALSGACIINADCASNQHCELGLCVTKCNVDNDCSDGKFCSARGMCVDDKNYIDVDSQIKVQNPVNWHLDQSVVQLNPGESGGSFNIEVQNGGVLQYRIEVEPEDARDAVTLNEEEGVVASGGSKVINLNIDRSSFEEGDHRLAVNVISDGGQQLVTYEFSEGYSGRYGGYVDYTDPGLGRVPLVVDMTIDDSGNVNGRILSDGSLLFPEDRVLTGNIDSSDGTIFLSAVDLIDAQADYDPFDREVGREIYFLGDLSEQRVIKGQFEEMISGLLPQAINVNGEFYLIRTLTEVDPVQTVDGFSMPAFPAVNGVSASYSEFEADCNDESKFRANMIQCSKSIRADSFKLGVDFVGTDGQGNDVANFGLVEECKSDVANSGSGACVDLNRMSNLLKAQQDYLISTTAQDSEYQQYFKDLNGMQRLFAFMGNDLLVKAYRTSVQDVSNPLTLEISRLEDAIEEFEKAEQIFYSPENLKVLGKATKTAVVEDNYDIFRVPLEYVRSSESVLSRLVSLIRRGQISKSDEADALRERMQDYARAVYCQGVLLRQVIADFGGAFEIELAQVADSLRDIARTTNQLNVSQNPVGFVNDYVPFIYDPSFAGQPNNFAQLVDSASSVVSSAVQKSETAKNSIELMELRTEEIQQKIQDVQLNIESEVLQMCGVSSISMIGECGLNGGELGLVFNDIEQQYLDIEKIHQQIMNLHQMVKIKRDSALQIMNAKNKSLSFLESSGAQVAALTMAEAEVRAAMLRPKSLLGKIGGFFKGAASMIGGGGLIASALSGTFNPMSFMKGLGGIAGGIGSMLSSGMGVAAGATNSSAALEMGRIATKKVHLRNMQQLRVQKEGLKITEIQAAEEVKMLLIQMAQLNLDLDLADIRLEKHAIRVENLVNRIDFLMHKRNVLLQQAFESVNNPLTNLSFRLSRDHSVHIAANEFEKALSDVYLAARGLEHELNVDLSQIESQLFQANSAEQLEGFLTCLDGWYDDYRIAFGSSHQEVTQISLREDVLGFTESRVDEVTGEIIMPQEIFRRVLLDPKHITQSGRVEFPFVTSIAGGNKQFSTLVCNDRINKIRVMIVGDFLGDNEATVMLRQEGNSYLRSCESDPDAENDILNTYHLDKRSAIVQSGINSFGLSEPNYELTGRSVASDRWVLVIPTGDETPNNDDLDLLNIDDIVIEITHDARTLNGSSVTSVFGPCNI